jgi:hypothetical protein
MPLFSRDDLAFIGKRMSRCGPALLNQPFEPIVRFPTLTSPDFLCMQTLMDSSRLP